MEEHRPVRRKDRLMPEKEARALLEKGAYGVLSTVGADGQPYGVPLSYVVLEDRIYFHCAKAGHKLENLARQPRVSFCVTGAVQAVFEKGDFSTNYESVVVFGEAAPVSGEAEKRRALTALCLKYLPQQEDKIEAALAASLQATAVYAISIGHMTGKKRPGAAR